MARLLAQFLREQARQPFRWGRSDCGLYVADWVYVLTQIDIAADLRGAYSDRRTAVRFSRGDLARAVGQRVCRAGFTATARRDIVGSAAVVAGPRGSACAIRTGTGWALRDDRALYVVSAPDANVTHCWEPPVG